MIQFDIITLFPQMFISPLGESIIKRAQQKGLVNIRVCDIRDYTEDKHHITDDYPYGGGAGMVMKVEPIVRAIEDQRKSPEGSRVILMTPQGKLFTQKTAERLCTYTQLIFVCGRYEGVDERVLSFVDEELSIGDFILTGGELAAMVVVDVVTRLIPDVIGERLSVLEDTFAENLLKYPQYTRPQKFRELEVPPVLLCGDHQKILQWRRIESLKKTLQRRPDLLEHACLTDEDMRILEELKQHEKMEANYEYH